MIHKFKNDFTEFEFFNSAKMYVDFKAKFGKDFIPFIRENSQDVEALSFALYVCHISACKLLKKSSPLESYEDLMDYLTIFDLGRCIEKVMDDQIEKEKQATKGQKKT
jgi:hypothetical protein